ncbi:Pyrroline-5-carboxylate reductase [hydrothermal vent metagenome]|uniref:Pyrroline-5-carboxylate reductase n=1 Tax=hydrothermal vent metagenome TaxID=652676 RepID=A0A3B0T081_9ZZZZ
MRDKPSVALIGAGAMGGALLHGWLAGGVIAPAHSVVFDPAINDEMKALCKTHGVALNPSLDDAIKAGVDAVVIAVKPQMASDVLGHFTGLASQAVVISVMAGKSVAGISAALGGAEKIARAMPNLPAAIGKGMTGLYAPDAVDDAGRVLVETLMCAAGETVWVSAEAEIDLVTAISGSGPAYYFLLTEALTEAGEALGLSKDTAAKLARATFIGAGALMDAETRSPSQMRRAVTSPGGTTQAALEILDGDAKVLGRLVEEAVRAAAARARALTD